MSLKCLPTKKEEWIYYNNSAMKFMWVVDFSTSIATRVMKYEHSKIHFTQICFIGLQKNKKIFISTFIQRNIACFISRRFIQGWMVTVCNACMNTIKLYKAFLGISGNFLNFRTNDLHPKMKAFEYICIELQYMFVM